MTNSRSFHTTLRLFKFGFVNIFRNLWLTIAATAVMLVALVIILIGIIINVTTSNAIDILSKDLKTTIFLASDVTDSNRAKVEDTLRNFDFVETIEYVSPKTAQDRLKKDAIIGSQVTQSTGLFEGTDFLKPSYEIALNDLSRASELSSIGEDPEFEGIVDRVALGKTDTGKTDAEKAIERAAATERFITIGSIVSAVALSAVSVMIIFNTIRMAIYTRRDEIKIMKLIGATPGYIRGPFLVEAALYGVFAGIIAIVTVYSLVFTLGSKVSTEREFVQTYDFFTEPSTIVLMTLSSIAVGVLIGIISSMLAMEKHLKLKHW